ncbi:MAG: TIGR03790 family protein, partial [Verrucomicrobia subdivision 3 bacterium]|nr:TIGR03790 family protein [Limisphaerales bacterium]
EASVDSQLAALPFVEHNPLWAGPMRNPGYGTTNAALLHPTNGIFLVTRLDGPTADVAAGMIHKAMEAETNGLWGRVYIDARGVTNGGYAQGDEWLRQMAGLARASGFETEVDQEAATWSAGYPMSQIAFYAGWYDWNASGPFTRSQVEFMPGAFAYHLHSFSAQTVRSTNANWVGPLLHKGATITMGNVDEPYLALTPDLPVFFHRFISGFNFAEAAWASANSISWQTVMLGDPLYRPYGQRYEQTVKDLERRRSALLEWPIARDVSVRLARGETADELIAYLENPPVVNVTRQSAVLTERLADLYWGKKKLSDGLDYYEAALKRYPSPQQKARLLLLLGQRRTLYGPDQKAMQFYQQFLTEYPDYPDKLSVYQKLLPLAQKTGDKKEVERLEAEIKRLSPVTAPAAGAAK